jgi:hypothetical protein
VQVFSLHTVRNRECRIDREGCSAVSLTSTSTHKINGRWEE